MAREAMEFEGLTLRGAEDVRAALAGRQATRPEDAHPWAWAERLARRDGQAAAWVVEALPDVLADALPDGLASHAPGDAPSEAQRQDLDAGLPLLAEALVRAVAAGAQGALGEAAAFYVYGLTEETRGRFVEAVAGRGPQARLVLPALRQAVEVQAGRFGAYRAKPVMDALDASLARAQVRAQARAQAEAAPAGEARTDAEPQTNPGDALDDLAGEVLASAGEALKEALAELDLSASELLDGLASLLGDDADDADGADDGDGAHGADARDAREELAEAPATPFTHLGFDPRPLFYTYLWEHGLVTRGADGQPTARVDVGFVLQHGPGLVQALLPAVRGGRMGSGEADSPPPPVHVDVDLGLDELQGWLTALLATLGR